MNKLCGRESDQERVPLEPLCGREREAELWMTRVLSCRCVCPPRRWTPRCWGASACWTQHPSCAAWKPTRCPRCSRPRPARTTRSDWPGSSGLPTATSSWWRTTGRSTASWSEDRRRPSRHRSPRPPFCWSFLSACPRQCRPGARPGPCHFCMVLGVDSCSCHPWIQRHARTALQGVALLSLGLFFLLEGEGKPAVGPRSAPVSVWGPREPENQ